MGNVCAWRVQNKAIRRSGFVPGWTEAYGNSGNVPLGLRGQAAQSASCFRGEMFSASNNHLRTPGVAEKRADERKTRPYIQHIHDFNVHRSQKKKRAYKVILPIQS